MGRYNEEEVDVRGDADGGAEILHDEAYAFLLDHYQPALRRSEPGAVAMGTLDIYSRLFAIFPGNYKASDVAAWLLEQGYRISSVIDLEGEWLLKPR